MRYIIPICCLMMVFAGCKKQESQITDANVIRVAASIYPLADIVRNVGGDKVKVMTIMPPGASPHTFDVTPQTIRNITNIKAIFKIGHGIDDWADRVAISVSGNAKVIEVSNGIDLRKLPDGSVDPHYWLSMSNGAIIAETIAKELTAMDPKDRDIFESNLKKYKAQMLKADEEIKTKLASLQNRSFATFHEAWFYFAQAYGLKVAAAFEPFPGKEPTPEYLADFIKTIKTNKIKVIFSEPQFSSDALVQVARDLQVKIDTLDPEGGATEQTLTYIGMMKYNADKLYNALSK